MRVQPILEWWKRFSQRPFIAHLLRAVERFNLRGGVQLAAAITYFSVLSLVPILMMVFSVLGFTATVFRPEWLGMIESWIRANLPEDSTLGGKLNELIVNALTGWPQFGVAGVLFTMWIGSGWVGNLKRAVRLLMRKDVDNPGKQVMMPLDVLANVGGLIGILVGVAATFASSAVATTLGSTVGEWLGVGGSLGWTVLIRLVGAVVSLGIGAVGFRLLLGWFSPAYVPTHLAWVGAGLGSAALLLLQALAAYLFGAFSRNLGTAVFGSTIVLMVFLNLFATLVLYIAAWLATSEQPAIEPEPEPVPEPPSAPVETKPGELYVSSQVAQRSLGIGLGAGYTIGAATGLGIGALLISALRAVFPRRKE
ncbi:MAG TPA: YhjD/YihY/BrkB family envelope integrity protein [Propionicimonas sp.]